MQEMLLLLLLLCRIVGRQQLMMTMALAWVVVLWQHLTCQVGVTMI
jgi:hypothetical protein